jgi:hypothetical protein
LLGTPSLFVALDLRPFFIGELGQRLGGLLDCRELSALAHWSLRWKSSSWFFAPPMRD